MKIADLLNPSCRTHSCQTKPLLSPCLSYQPKSNKCHFPHPLQPVFSNRPRSRFSELEDNIICQGVAKGLTWGQISGQMPHRKRATCFNRYRTIQGMRKSRKYPLYTSNVRSSPPASSTSVHPNTRSSSLPVHLPSPVQYPLALARNSFSPEISSQNSRQHRHETSRKRAFCSHDPTHSPSVRLPPLGHSHEMVVLSTSHFHCPRVHQIQA